MDKKWFGILLLILLAGIAAVNIIKDRKEITEIENPGIEVADQEAESSAAAGIGLGDLPPDFSLQTLDGKKVSLSDYRGKKVILNFWATWCPPCKAEMPHMQSFYEKEAEKSGTEILAVNLTSKDNGQATVADFVKQYDLTFPVLLDEEGAVGEKYQVSIIPTTYFLNTDGTVHQVVKGPMDEEMMRGLVDEME
ncbi:redoxin domain-containing protein [Pseudobacillus badius]|uniref:redoxin domain-containing protein n=1 Tax=Bacillus badius TaxID=1455 RepID=UPI001CBC35EA|nr:redoxin domain-containing protein [Bacillus badius]UAT30294.1 redoxin domain-containing protein [Bacillus badius]GLY09295.1 thiol:disulfide interchange protein tlpA [Bacillus badius]